MKKIFLIFLLFNISLFIFSSEEYITSDYFGLHMNNFMKKESPYINKPWPNVPFTIWRLWDTGICWPEIQPNNKDEWNLGLLDKAVELAVENKVELVLNIGLSPRWAAARPNNKSGYGENLTASEPKNIEDWKNYVRKLAERYNGKIKYWEIWNEPDMTMFYTGNINKMVEITKEAYLVLKSVNKDNKIISPSVTGYVALLPWLNNYLKAGGKNYIDIIGTHFYVWFQPDAPEKIYNTLATINNYLKENQVENIPIWNTECGFKQENVKPDLQPAFLARLAILNWYYGSTRFFPYSWNNKVIIKMIDKDSDLNTINPVGIAYREIQNWLIDSKIIKITNDANIWIARLERKNGNKALIIWHNHINQERIDKLNLKNYGIYNKLKNLKQEILDIKDNAIEVSAMPVLIMNNDY